MNEIVTTKARLLRSYHEDGSVLVLPNAWDAGSAAVIAAAGARAIATTSGGVAWSLGRPDGERLGRDEMIAAVGRIVAAVDVPVTADVEAGYGPAPEDAATTARAVIDCGAVGINLEDSRAPGGPLFTVEEQVRRLAAAREAANELVINARTDVFLFRIGDRAGRLDDVKARAEAYIEAGADCVFVPGLLNLVTLEELTRVAPISVMAGPGGPTVAELAAVGVRRISVGTGMAQAAYAAARNASVELLNDGTFDLLKDGIGFAELNQLFR